MIDRREPAEGATVEKPNAMMLQRTIYRLDEVSADPELVGSKAASLARLMSMGITIPLTAVIPIPVYRRMAEAGTRDPSKMGARIASLRLDEIRSDILEYLRRQFGVSRFAVRSSANVEDLEDKSFAGQYESVIDVPLEGVPDAIREVWRSLWSEEAMSYRATVDRIPGMAVMIQPFIAGRMSGIAFSANPMTGNPFEIVFEYSSGDCSGVTDGRTQTETLVLDVRGLLSGKEAPEPFATVAAVCQRFDRPVDLEWTVDSGGRVLILQERPLVLKRRHILESAELLKYKLALPEPLSRLGASLEFEKNRIYQRVVRRLGSPRYTSRTMTVYSRQFLREEHEEPSYSAAGAIATGVRAANQLPTYLLLRRRLLRNPGVRPQPQRHTNPIDLLLGLVAEYLRLYESSIYVAQTYSLFTGLLVRYAYFLTGGRLARPLLYNLFRCPSSISAVRDSKLSALAQQLVPAGADDWLAIQTDEFQQTYAAYCREFGYVFNEGSPRDPYSRIDSKLAYRLLRNIQGARPTEDDGALLESVEREIRATRLGPIHLLLFRAARRLYQPMALIKEDRNHLFYLASARLRDFITNESESLGRELSLRSIDEIYFLSLREIAARERSERRLRLRQRLYLLSRAFVDPYPHRSRAAVPAGAPYLEGIPCAPGTASGQVVFVETRDDFAKVRPGSILVTHTVRPFWTPILRSCHGLLASSGNILSHGASIAREYGVPAVFGLGEQIVRLREGQVVTVDGSRGKVFVDQAAPNDQACGAASLCQ